MCVSFLNETSFSIPDNLFILSSAPSKVQNLFLLPPLRSGVFLLVIMIHRCSAEAKALTALTAFIVVFITLRILLPEFPSWCKIGYLGFAAVVCRFLARYGSLKLQSLDDSCGLSIPWSNASTVKRVALVTGGSSGVGFSVAENLLLSGWIVIITGPHLQRLLVARGKLLEARKKYLQKKRNCSLEGDVLVLGVLDLADESSVRQFASIVLENQTCLPISLLVNAAGTLKRELQFCKLTSRWWEVEKMVATNAVGPLLLSVLLLPLLQRVSDEQGNVSRIINIASSCHTYLSTPFLSIRKVHKPLEMLANLALERAKQVSSSSDSAGILLSNFDSSQLLPNRFASNFTWYNFVEYYGLSKLCVMWNTQFLSSLAARKPVYLQESPAARPSGSVLVACTHPGVICSHLYRELFPTWLIDNLLYYPSLLVMKTIKEGGVSTLRAINENPENFVPSGYYLSDGDHSYGKTNCVSSAALSNEHRDKYISWVSQLIPEVQESRTKAGI